MRRLHFRKGSFATVTAVTALVIAMGGTGYAASLITSKQIKNGTIRGVDIHAATIPSSKLVPGTIPAPYGGTFAYSTYHDGGVNITTQVGGLDPVVLTLNIPTAGSYTVLATEELFNSGAGAVDVRCVLNAGGDSDTKHVTVGPNGSAGDDESNTLQVVHTFASAGAATLRCYSFGANAGPSNIKITATKVDHLSNIPG